MDSTAIQQEIQQEQEQIPIENQQQHSQQQQQNFIFQQQETDHSLRQNGSIIPPNPLDSFLWGAHNLFAGLHAVNTRLEILEQTKNLKNVEAINSELNSLKSFTLSVYNQLQAHDDFVRNEKFLQGVEQRAYETVVSKCLPEIWKMRAHVDLLAEEISKSNNNSTNRPKPPGGNHHRLAQEVEDILLRLAAFGDEKIQHIEIIGDGRRYKSGAPKRMIVTEKQLASGTNYPNLPVPRSWKADSDTRTINKNFEQVTKMVNEIVLGRIDEVEKRIDDRLERLEKRVDILSSLFHVINRKQNNEEQEQTKIQKNTNTLETVSSEPEIKIKTTQNSIAVVTKTTTCTQTSTLTSPETDSPIEKPPEITKQEKQNPKKSHQSGAKAGRAAFNRSITKKQ